MNETNKNKLKLPTLIMIPFYENNDSIWPSYYIKPVCENNIIQTFSLPYYINKNIIPIANNIPIFNTFPIQNTISYQYNIPVFQYKI